MGNHFGVGFFCEGGGEVILGGHGETDHLRGFHTA